MIISLVKSIAVKDIDINVEKENIRLPIAVSYKGEAIGRLTEEEAFGIGTKLLQAVQEVSVIKEKNNETDKI